jgi:hypothetical protein
LADLLGHHGGYSALLMSDNECPTSACGQHQDGAGVGVGLGLDWCLRRLRDPGNIDAPCQWQGTKLHPTRGAPDVRFGLMERDGE